MSEINNKITRDLMISLRQNFRAICEWWLAHHHRQIGGLGEVVEIDEALISRRKNNVWVLSYIKYIVVKF